MSDSPTNCQKMARREKWKRDVMAEGVCLSPFEHTHATMLPWP